MISSFLVVSCVLLGQVETDVDVELTRRVNSIVRQLNNPEREKRDAAEQELIKLGPQVLDRLPQITRRTSAEVKVRLQRVAKTLETQMAKAATTGSRVTLEGEMLLAEAMAALEKQTGNRVVGYANRDSKIKLSLKDMLYWPALDQVLDQAGLNINPYGGQRKTLTVAARPDEELPRFGSASYSGLFRFEATRIEAARDLRNPALNGLRLHLAISWEPRNTPISISQPLSEVEALDENGDSISIDGVEGSRDVAVESDISAVDLDLPLKLPTRDVQRIASLKGTLTALIPGREETFEFTDVMDADNDEQERAGVTVVLERVRQNVDLHEVRIRVRFDRAANALESHRGWIYNNEAYLLDADGKRIPNAGLEATSQAANEVGLAYLFALEKDAKNLKFVYRTPALIVRTPVPYELRDIELP